nr:MAG TPA: hypothetical protein [Crassvirales sp.]
MRKFCLFKMRWGSLNFTYSGRGYWLDTSLL